MRRLAPLLSIALLAACSAPASNPPSLAPRAAEAIDPRLPIDAVPSPGTLDPALRAQLADAASSARGAAPEFERLSADAERLAAAAGPSGGEGWVAAQQALSALIAQHGITTRAAADVDALAASRIDASRWIAPANRAAIEAAAAEVGAINEAQAGTIARLSARLGI